MAYWEVDHGLCWFKLAYFFRFMSVAAIVPFWPALCRDAGLTTEEFGVVYGIFPFIVFIARPSSGLVADRFHAHKTVLAILVVLTFLSVLPSCVYLSDTETDRQLLATRYRMENESVDDRWPRDELNFSSLMSSLNVSETSVVSSTVVAYARPLSRWFWLMFFCSTAYYATASAQNTVLDALTYSALGEQKGKWGRQKLWGIISYGVFSAALGALLQLAKWQAGKTVFYPLYIWFGLSCLLLLANVRQLAPVSGEKSSHVMADTWAAMRTGEVAVLMWTMLLYGLLMGVDLSFRSWFLKELGASELLLGLVTLPVTVCSVAVMMCVGWVIERIGYNSTIRLAGLFYVVQYVGYALIPSPWWALLVECLSAFSQNLLLAAATQYASVVALPGTAASLQGVATALYFGIGRGCGALLGGACYAVFGPRTMFYGCAVLAAFAVGSGAVLQQLLLCYRRGIKRPLDSTEQCVDDTVAAEPLEPNTDADRSMAPEVLHSPPAPRRAPRALLSKSMIDLSNDGLWASVIELPRPPVSAASVHNVGLDWL